MKTVSSSRQNITRLLSELELSPNTPFEREVVSDGDLASLTVETMDAVKQYNDEVSFSNYVQFAFLMRAALALKLLTYVNMFVIYLSDRSIFIAQV